MPSKNQTSNNTSNTSNTLVKKTEQRASKKLSTDPVAVVAESVAVVAQPAARSKSTRTKVVPTQIENVSATGSTSSEPSTTERATSSLNVDLPAEVVSQLKFEAIYSAMQQKIDSHLAGLKLLRSEAKKLQSAYEGDLNRVRKSKKKRSGKFQPTGFIKETTLPNDLADLIGVQHGTKMSTPALTSKLYEVFEQRGSFLEKSNGKRNRRVFVADAEMLRVFGLPKEVNDSTDFNDMNGFNFKTLQKHISRCLKRNAALESTGSAEVTAPVPEQVQLTTNVVEETITVSGKKSKTSGTTKSKQSAASRPTASTTTSQ